MRLAQSTSDLGSQQAASTARTTPSVCALPCVALISGPTGSLWNTGSDLAIDPAHLRKGLTVRTAANAIHVPGMLLALTLAAPAQAGCQDSPGPRVDWTGCSRNLLMLGGDDLTEGVFSRAKLTSTDFRRAKLPRAKLNEGEISFTRFEDANLSGADLSKAVGWRVNFNRANLEGANFTGADLSRAVFTEAKASAGNFSKSEMSRADFSRADLTGADLSKAEAARTVFTDANLSGVRFNYSDLARATLDGLDLAGVDFTGAYLFLTQLKGADLSRAFGLTQDQLALACGTNEIKLPARMVQPDSWPCGTENE
jgi:uncharacterized protein YjbI with pentapeptide repeats